MNVNEKFKFLVQLNDKMTMTKTMNIGIKRISVKLRGRGYNISTVYKILRACLVSRLIGFKIRNIQDE